MKKAFTLIEVLIVIGIIVIVLGLATIALNAVTGARSIDGAENNLSATLGRIRADAMGLQKDMGAFFFIDPASGRVMIAQVQAVDKPNTAVEVFLDLVPDRDFFQLPKGIGAQIIDNCAVSTAGVRGDDAYIGYNRYLPGSASPTLRYGGVILFDGQGRLVSKTYAFRGSFKDSSGADLQTDMFELLSTGKIDPGSAAGGADFGAPIAPPFASDFGVVLFELDPFNTNWTNGDSQIDTAAAPDGGGAYNDASNPKSPEAAEEQWLDQNAVPLMVNRYNGTLIRGE
jgi:prepilin-type N-terminal cleavage/methylation domain-containing protein